MPGARIPAAQTAADAAFAIWNLIQLMPHTPAAMGTIARSGPKKRPTNTAATPHRSKNANPLETSSGWRESGQMCTSWRWKRA